MLLLFVSGIAVVVALVLGLGSLFGLFLGGASGHSGLQPALAFGSLGILVIVAGVGVVLALVSIILLFRGFRMLKAKSAGIGIGATGILLEIVGVVLGGILSSLSSLGAGGVYALIGIIGYIIAFIGAIIVLVGFWRIGSAYDSTLLKVGAVLYLLISIVGVILLYIGLGDAIKKESGSGGAAKK